MTTDSNPIELVAWREPNLCLVHKKTLADGTRIRCTSDGKLIVEHAAGGSRTGTSARYLFEGRLSNGSDFRQIYEVKFIECKYGFSIDSTLRKQKILTLRSCGIYTASIQIT